MTEALSTINNAELGLTTSTDGFDMVSTAGGSYLPRLQLGGGSSEVVKEGKVMIGNHYLVENDEVTDLGKKVDVLVLAWLPKAMDVSGDKPITCFDPNSDDFKRLMAKSNIKDSKTMYGPAFMVYIPQINKFAEYFMSSKTARKESKNMMARMSQGATLGSELIKTDKNSWHGPKVFPCATPLAPPTADDIKTANEKFVAQKQQVVETVQPTADTRKR